MSQKRKSASRRARSQSLPRRRSSSAKQRERRKITPEDLREFQNLSDPQVSPDGRSVVFVHKKFGDRNEPASNLWRVEVDGKDPAPFTAGGRDCQPRWSPDGQRIAFVGARDRHRPQILLIDAGGGEAQPLTSFPEGSIARFCWSPDGRKIAVSFREQDPQWTQEAQSERNKQGHSDPPRVLDDWWYRLDGDGVFSAQRHRLYLVDVATGKHKKIFTRDTLGLLSFAFSPDGKRLAISANTDRRALVRPEKAQIFLLNIASLKAVPIPGLPPGPKAAVAWSPDGRWLAYAGREGTDGEYSTENLQLWVVEVARGRARNLTGREDYCLAATTLSDTAEVAFEAALCWSHDSRRIFVGIGWHGEQHVASVPVRGGRLRFHTSGEVVVAMGNLSRDGRRMALTVSSPLRLAEVHVGHVGSDTMQTNALTDLNGPLLKELRLSRPRSTWILSTGGTKVQIWAMKPVDLPARRKAPAVLEIHGGPHAQYGVGFFHEFQVLAAAGYAVFFSNPRGSKGYGRDHCADIRGAWGGADWEDVQAVTAHLKTRPFVDPHRLGVMGGSYGGYMTNWAIGHSREFKAAITDRSVSNMVSMWGSSDLPEAPDRYWPGNCWSEPEALWEQSPLKYIGAARTPTLIIHSEGDLRCNIEQAEQLFTALQHLRVKTRFVRYPRSTSHGMSRAGPADLRVHRLHQILEWWVERLQ